MQNDTVAQYSAHMVAERGRKTGRHGGMAEYMRMVGEQPAEPSIEVQNLRSDAQKDVLGGRRTVWRVTTNAEQAVAMPVPQIMENITEVIRLASQERNREHIVDAPATQRCLLIMNDCDEFIPEWLNVVEGVVASEDLPLNICCQTLLQNKILRVIKKKHVTKYLEMLAEIAEQKDDDCKKFYKQFGKRLKLGNHEYSTVGVKIAELLGFNTSKSGDDEISLKDYVDQMKEGQNDISYIAGESIAAVSSSPLEENLHKKGHEVAYMADPADECAVHQFKEFGGKMLKSVAKEGFDLGDDDEKNKIEELKAEFKPLTKLMKEILGDNVEMMIVSDRIADSQCVPSTSEYGWSAKTRRIMNAQALRDNSMTSHMVSKAEAQQQHKSSSKHQPTKQSTRQERGGERKKERNREGKGGRSEQEEEKEAEEGGNEQVEKGVMGWTEVTRKRRRKTVQIFVKVDGSRVTPVEVSPAEDKVEDVLKRIQKDEDAYVTLHGRVLKRGEKLKSCGVSDGCTIQVTSRMRGGGKHKDKKSKAEKRPAASTMQPEPLQMEKVLEEMVTCIVEGSDVEGEQRLQSFLTTIQKSTGWDKGQLEIMECRIRQAVEEKRRENIEERDQAAEQEQNKKVRFAEEKPPEETQEQSTDKQDVMSGLEELRTGRGSRPLVRGGDEKCRADEISSKGKGKGNGGKGEHGSNGGAGSKGTRQVENLAMDEVQENIKAMTSEEKEKRHKEDVRKLVEMVEKEEMELEMMQQEEMRHEEPRGQVAPNMEAGGSHLQATSDPRETRVLSWADCKDEEETTEERPPGLEEEEEEVESEPKTQEEEKHSQVESEQEAREQESRAHKAQEEETRAQEAREEERRAQEAREEETRAQEAREEEKRAQEARELKRAQEAREEQKRAQEAREEQKRAQEAREEQRAQEAREEQRRAQEAQDEKRAQEEQERLAREAKAQEERREQDREAVTQEGHEGEVKAQEEQGENANSLHEESHVSNRHMTWWRNAWWVRVNNGPHLQTARDRRRVWRAATRAAQEVRDTGRVPGGEREKWEQGKTESNTLHVIFHFNPTAAAAAASAATVRLQ